MAIISDRSKKWVLVGVMSLLMVAFTLPSWIGSGQGGGGKDFSVGTTTGGKKLMTSEIELAKYEWQELLEIPIEVQVVGRTGISQSGRIPVASLLFVEGEQLGRLDEQSLRILEVMLSEYRKRPELYALLKREAREAGIRPNRDRLESLMVNNVNAGIQADPRRSILMRQALGNLLAVDEMSEQAALAVKVTRPEIRAELARRSQALDLTAVVFEASEFKEKISAPTDEAARELFARFGSRVKGDTDVAGNAFGFGYRQGDRIRLETIVVPLTELRRAVRATREDYDWEVEANKYYLANKAEFRVTDLSLDAAAPAAAGEEKFESFEEVRKSIETQLVDARAAQLAQVVQRKLTSLLAVDYRAFAGSVAKKLPPPASSVGPAFDTFEYLSALAARIEGETKVRPSVTTFGEKFLDAEALGMAEGVGMAVAEVSAGRPIMMAQFLLSRAKLFFATSGAAREPGATALEMFEPTPVFRTLDGGLTIARVLDAKENRVPMFEEVAEAVRADALTLALGEAARAAATELSATGKEQLLSGVAKVRGRTPVEVQGLMDGTPLPLSLGSIGGLGRQLVTQAAFDLLRQPESTDGSSARPRAVVALPRDGKVVVLELQDIVSLAPDSQRTRFEIGMGQQLRSLRTGGFLFDYFQRESVTQRSGFKADRPEMLEEKTSGM